MPGEREPTKHMRRRVNRAFLHCGDQGYACTPKGPTCTVVRLSSAFCSLALVSVVVF